MFTKYEKEVAEVLFCKQIIRLLIASIIKFVTSVKKHRFDLLIKSQLHWNQKHLPILYNHKKSRFHHSVFPCFGKRQRNSIYSYVSPNIYRIHQRKRQQHDNWYAFLISFAMSFEIKLRFHFLFSQIIKGPTTNN